MRSGQVVALGYAEIYICFVEANIDPVRRLARAVTTLVTDASRGMSRAFDVNRVGVLGLAVEHPGITPGELAQRLHLPASSVTRHAQALEAAGHLALRRSQRDGRSANVEATAAGIAELAALQEVGAEVFGSVVADWSTEDVERLAELLERLVAAWQQRGDGTLRHRRRVSRWQHETAPDQGTSPRPNGRPRHDITEEK
jgi:DNA-binding MarR family transcriptional regulator